MSYRTIVVLWAIMAVLIVAACFFATPAHAIQAYPDITANDKQQSEPLPIDDVIPTLGPAVYYTTGEATVTIPVISQIPEQDRIDNQNRLFSWVVTVFIVLFACGWLLFMLLTPWQFPHYGSSPGRVKAADKCAMPVKKPDALWRKLLD